MTSLLETHRRLYNNALAERKCVYEAEQRTVTYGGQSAKIKTERKINSYLALANFSSCQRTLKRLDRAFQSFFRRVKQGDKAGYPRFRGYGRFDSVDFTIDDGAKFTKDGKARFQNVGDVKLKLHRAIEGTIKTATCQRHAGRWYVVFVCEVEQTVCEPSENPSVGIDLGLKSFLVTSEGEAFDAPKLYRKAQAKLRRSQRAVARKKRGGANRKKAVKTLAKIHAHVANQRKDFHHKTAKSLVDRYGVIVHEGGGKCSARLNIKGIVRSLRLAKSTNDAGWAGFLNILKMKAESAAVQVISVNPKNTIQACSRCGCLPTTPIGLSVRVYVCEHCQFSLDRDWNASINIKNKAGILPLQVNVGDCVMRSARSLPL